MCVFFFFLLKTTNLQLHKVREEYNLKKDERKKKQKGILKGTLSHVFAQSRSSTVCARDSGDTVNI